MHRAPGNNCKVMQLICGVVCLFINDLRNAARDHINNFIIELCAALLFADCLSTRLFNHSFR